MKPESAGKFSFASLPRYLFLFLWTVCCCYPFLWVIITSFKNNEQIFGDPFGLPKSWLFQNYSEAWSGASIGQDFLNSCIICFAAIAILSLIASMAAYTLTRVVKSVWLNAFFTLGLMIPIHAVLIPSVILFKNIGLINSLLSMIIIYVSSNLSISIFILTGFYEVIPKEMEESATMDGCGRVRLFFSIMLPISKPGIATAATLSFLNSWNDLLYGLVLISSPQLKTITMGIAALKGSYETQYGMICAGFVIAILPVVLMYTLFQKQIIKGMTAGAVKG